MLSAYTDWCTRNNFAKVRLKNERNLSIPVTIINIFLISVSNNGASAETSHS